MDITKPRLRQAARALIIDEHDRVLLVCFPTGDGNIWATPGGGLERGETMAAGLRRELDEELGRGDLPIGPLVWTRTAIFPVGGNFDGQYNEIYLVRTEHFDPEPTIGWDGMRAEGVDNMRWWSLDEIDASPDRFVPSGFARLTRHLLTDGPPGAPVEASGAAFGRRPELAEQYDLEPHPEGGWYRQTWVSPVTVTLPDGRVRPTATLIYFLLPAGESSSWHRVSSDELWLAHHGGVTIELGGRGDEPVFEGSITIGTGDYPPQGLVPAGVWQRTVPRSNDAMASCLVSPGFDFDDFELAPEESR